MHVVFEHTCNNVARYFGAAKDLPGVRELFEQEREFVWLVQFSVINICCKRFEFVWYLAFLQSEGILSY